MSFPIESASQSLSRSPRIDTKLNPLSNPSPQLVRLQTSTLESKPESGSDCSCLETFLNNVKKFFKWIFSCLCCVGSSTSKDLTTATEPAPQTMPIVDPMPAPPAVVAAPILPPPPRKEGTLCLSDLEGAIRIPKQTDEEDRNHLQSTIDHLKQEDLNEEKFKTVWELALKRATDPTYETLFSMLEADPQQRLVAGITADDATIKTIRANAVKQSKAALEVLFENRAHFQLGKDFQALIILERALACAHTPEEFAAAINGSTKAVLSEATFRKLLALAKGLFFIRKTEPLDWLLSHALKFADFSSHTERLVSHILYNEFYEIWRKTFRSDPYRFLTSAQLRFLGVIGKYYYATSTNECITAAEILSLIIQEGEFKADLINKYSSNEVTAFTSVCLEAVQMILDSTHNQFTSRPKIGIYPLVIWMFKRLTHHVAISLICQRSSVLNESAKRAEAAVAFCRKTLAALIRSGRIDLHDKDENDATAIAYIATACDIETLESIIGSSNAFDAGAFSAILELIDYMKKEKLQYDSDQPDARDVQMVRLVNHVASFGQDRTAIRKAATTRISAVLKRAFSELTSNPYCCAFWTTLGFSPMQGDEETHHTWEHRYRPFSTDSRNALLGNFIRARAAPAVNSVVRATLASFAPALNIPKPIIALIASYPYGDIPANSIVTKTTSVVSSVP